MEVQTDRSSVRSEDAIVQTDWMALATLVARSSQTAEPPAAHHAETQCLEAVGPPERAAPASAPPPTAVAKEEDAATQPAPPASLPAATGACVA